MIGIIRVVIIRVVVVVRWIGRFAIVIRSMAIVRWMKI